MAGNKVQIGTVCRNTLAVVVQAENFLVWQRNTTNAITPAVVAILVFVDIVTEMNNIINGVLQL